MIKRLHPAKALPQSPLSAFSVLLIGQGFGSQSEFEVLVKQRFWPRLVGTPPFERLTQPRAQNRMFLFYDPCQELDLQLTQNGSALSIPPAAKDRLTQFLQTHTVQSDAPKQTVRGSDVWPTSLRSGRNGSLVVAILKGSTRSELWRLDASDAYPTPLLGVVTADDDWMMPIIRTIGQLYAGLADEFSFTEDEDKNTGDHHDKMPLYFLAPLPNLVPCTDEQKLRLKQGENWRSILGCVPPAFKLNANASPTFIDFELNADGPDATSPGVPVNWFEGGAGFRHNVLRGFKDCLMRRRPLGSGGDPIQAKVDFCRVCQNAIQGAMDGVPDFDLTRARQITIDKQTTMYDLINWGDTIKKSTGVLPQTPFFPAANVKPRWSFKAQADAGIGLRITDLMLHDREGDPFNDAHDVLQEIDYGPLFVTWDGDTEATQLQFTDAFSNTAHPPRVETAGPDPGGSFQLGLKVLLTWDFPDKRPIEVAFTFVARGPKNDFDPGGVALACKFYPQIAMRVLQPFKRSGKTRPKAKLLRGTITCVCNNVIPKTINAPGLAEFSTGIVQGSFFTDSNSTSWDNDYTLDEDTSVEIVAPDRKIPYFKLRKGIRKGGRLMASVGNPGITNPDPTLTGGSTALYAFKNLGYPVLPYWSWLFDYASPALGQRKEVPNATYATGEVTADQQHSGWQGRQTTKAWPPGTDGKMTIQKEPRQGQYDNIHVHAAMPPMPGMTQQLVAAPFCADLCLHLHWRWGLDAVSSLAAPYAFYGWGISGRGAQGAHTTLGAPLIPPNQHLRVVGEPHSDQTLFTLSYGVTALDPAINAWQVFLEQGMAVAFRYAVSGLTDGYCSALDMQNFIRLLVALGVIEVTLTGNEDDKEEARLRQMYADKKLAELDAAIRRHFHGIYSKIRFYQKSRDGSDAEQIPTNDQALEDF